MQLRYEKRSYLYYFHAIGQNIGEALPRNKKNPLSNILITEESNLDERSGQLNRGAYILKVISTSVDWWERCINLTEQLRAILRLIELILGAKKIGSDNFDLLSKFYSNLHIFL